MRDQVLGGYAGGTLTPRSLKGVLASSESKGKPPSSSFSPCPIAGSSSKRPRTGSMGAPPSRLSFVPPPAPYSKEEVDTPPRSSHASSACLHNRQSLDQERGRNPLVADLRRGVLSLG
ncbi:UNVERIFIED_CONTAM: hypothetical protein Sindi_2031900 [Sesamum indicum]